MTSRNLAPDHRPRRCWIIYALFPALFTIAVALAQIHVGAYSTDRGQSADEASHYVTSVMIADYFHRFGKTHDYGWEIAQMGEEIPLYAILAERIPHPEGDELDWARKYAEQNGLA
jgi:hypothetical protein